MERVAVVGASGYVGRRLVRALAGSDVLAVGRRLDALPEGDGITRVAADVGDTRAMTAALSGVDTAYYLVHSMATGPGFAGRDRDAARSFAEAAAGAGVRRVVYLGGLGAGELSSHLASRQEVGRVLAEGPVPVVELRAAVVLGSGSLSFEMLRYLTERLPVMVCPRWVTSRVQPIAEADLLDCLLRAATAPPGVYEVGGPDVLTYEELMQIYARVRGLPRRRIARVPLLTPGLSARWVDVVTPVDRAVSRALVDSLRNDVVVARATDPFPVTPTPAAEAIRAALDGQRERVARRVFDFRDGLVDGVHALRTSVPMDPVDVHAARLDLTRCGGSLGWYGLVWAWWLRIALGRVFGERLRLRRPPVVAEGAAVDWWTVAVLDDHRIVLVTDQWFCGEAWLAYRIVPGPRPRLEQIGALRTRGLLGWAYWRAVYPIHLVVFRVMARKQTRRAHAMARSEPPGADALSADR